jgi:hypothetical protein
LPVVQACRKRRTISSDSRRDTVKRGRESRRRPCARVRICRVFASLVPTLLATLEVELEHLAQQEDRALCGPQGRRQIGGFLIPFCQRFGQPCTAGDI